ncbi:hypothetical protein [Agrococcus sp. ProA11]
MSGLDFEAEQQEIERDKRVERHLLVQAAIAAAIVSAFVIVRTLIVG